jgi:hypothetical protein
MIISTAKHMSLHFGLWCAGCLLLLGGLCIFDGLLPIRSAGPSPSWAEVLIGLVIVACSWCIRVSVMRSLARERQSTLTAAVMPEDSVVAELGDGRVPRLGPARPKEQERARPGQPVAPPEPPPRGSVPDAHDDRTLDSLPAPGSGGGR